MTLLCVWNLEKRQILQLAMAPHVLEEMDRALPIHSNVKKMCKRFNQSMAMGSTAMGAPLKGA